MALACCYLGKKNKAGALEAMLRMHRSGAMKKWIYFGGAKRWFDNAVFDPVRDDPEFTALVQGGDQKLEHGSLESAVGFRI